MTISEESFERLRNDPLADHLNMNLVEVRPGYARVEMEAAEELCGFHGYIQGGALVALADYALSAASNADGVGAVPLTLHVTFVARIRPGRLLVAEATEEKLGRRTGLYRLVVSTEDNLLVASGQGVAYRRETGAS